MIVADASALLAFVQGESGAEIVESALEDGCACSAVNWSEVAQKVLAAGRDWDIVRALLLSYDVAIEPVDADDAEWAARRWVRGEGLSLADRLCLALAARTEAVALTADAAWPASEGVRHIR